MRIRVKVKWVSFETLDVPDYVLDSEEDLLSDYLSGYIGDIVSDPEPVDWEII